MDPLPKNMQIDSESSDDDFRDEDHSSSNHNTTSDTPESGTSSDQQASQSAIAQAETRALYRSKVAVVSLLAMTAILAAGLAYHFSRQAETADFERQFDDYANSIDELVHLEAHDIYVAVDGFAHTVTSYTHSSNKTWPFITMPDFEIRGHDVIKVASVVAVAFSPLIVDVEKEAYEIFTTYNEDWIADGIAYTTGESLPENFKRVPSKIYRWEELQNGNRVPTVENGPGPFLPVWQTAPAPMNPRVVNFNLLSSEPFAQTFETMQTYNNSIVSKAMPLADIPFEISSPDLVETENPHSVVLGPIYDNFTQDAKIVGTVAAVIDWSSFFSSFLAVDDHPVLVVMHGSCGDDMSFEVRGHDVEFLGYEDFHDPKYNHLERSSVLDLSSPHNDRTKAQASGDCQYVLRIYPTDELEDAYRSPQPVIYAICMLLVFAMTAAVFLVYDIYVRRRQQKVLDSAAKSAAIVHSLFPKSITDRMMKDLDEQKKGKDDSARFKFSVKNQMKDFLQDDKNTAVNVAAGVYDTKPIADLFPACTVLFADIVGFTAWSSVREPSQVFVLLETLYASFDSIAKRRRIFKVETIGDCYVAVSGLPEPRKDHASAMCRFARDIQIVMQTLCKDLENTLGPDTGDLGLRVGLHSGPVTAGVLRGDKSRFQLFGDTVNTAARMESTGMRDRIHMSFETAEQLRAGGKENWTKQRDDKIVAKGKGEMETFWLVAPRKQSATSDSSTDQAPVEMATESHHVASMSDESDDDNGVSKAVDKSLKEQKPLPPKLQRLVRWNADVLNRLLKQIVARRNAKTQQGLKALLHSASSAATDESSIAGGTVIDEVKEVIALPKFDAKAARNQQDPRTIQLDKEVTDQLHNYVTVIASLYRSEVPFHNFEHASHVTMSVVKMISRVVAPEEVLSAEQDDEGAMQKNLHDHTYGITSDPLTQFAVVLSALVHDVDHTGVPNTTLIKEGSRLAKVYKNKSIAEQNSVDIALDLLMDESFNELRATIYSSENEKKRFRQLVVNTVMATDIVDKDLKELRNARWDKAFQHKVLYDAAAIQEDVNRKATIVIEHLIQASDVAHTMQHWHIYRKWNENFFFENLHAYRSGRAGRDPAEFWYKGEMGFFDFYIIPLAKKLKECGVFGVSCDEYLNYALANRKEWESRGEDEVAEMLEKYNNLFPPEAEKFNDETAEEKSEQEVVPPSA
ncbi:Receptor-type guanylate cyclase gcy [Seminavis robusta]|uniref:Receptor-type guanylate cyclase gcy n=1 Tax=Seminavis robusta TaxID=568900 RepID=A0A9N8E6S8_9STRA|nr:Receptor-type guanylate cyclase gcy [Seminavis robusta]|eukprot:Sro683_g186610.1 Receptor-type guanylate cyclase gcy (1195) ;mRNA; f:10053-15633